MSSTPSSTTSGTNNNNNNNNITSQQWTTLLTQFAQFKTQFNEQQILTQSLQKKVQDLESNSSLQHNLTLSQYESKLEELFYQIEQSQDDMFCQHQLDMLNLISLRIHNVEYRGAALRDLFQLRRGQIPRTVTTLTIGDYIKWCNKRLKQTTANLTQYTYYHTLLKLTHFDHIIMDNTNIKLTTLPLNPHYFPTTLMLWSPLPPTPIEYHRLLIAIAYDLDFHEINILPLLTHFGLPINGISLSIPTTPLVMTPTTNTNTSSSSNTANNNNNNNNTDPYFYFGQSPTHIPSLLYSPLFFGILSRESFRTMLLEKTPIDGNSFITTRWFSSLCRFGYLFDQIARVLCGFNQDGLYPQHQSYLTILPRFFSSSGGGGGEDTLTDPITFPSFGNKHFSKLYAFMLFISAHLAITHSQLHSTTLSNAQTTATTTNTNEALSSSSSTPTNTTSLHKHPFKSTTNTKENNNNNNNSTTTTNNNTLDTITYPIIRDLYQAAVKGSLDTQSLTFIFKSTELYQHLTPNERNKSNFTRLFSIFHFKILAGTVPSWLAKGELGVPKVWSSGSVFEGLCGLGHCDHLSKYFDKNSTNCCDKRTVADANNNNTNTNNKGNNHVQKININVKK